MGTRPLPRVMFDRESIRTLVPKRPTVYRLYRVDAYGNPRLLYIGASADPKTRLLAHLRSGKPALYVALEWCGSTTMMARREREAIETEPTELSSGFGRRHKAWKARARA